MHQPHAKASSQVATISYQQRHEARTHSTGKTVSVEPMTVEWRERDYYLTCLSDSDALSLQDFARLTLWIAMDFVRVSWPAQANQPWRYARPLATGSHQISAEKSQPAWLVAS